MSTLLVQGYLTSSYATEDNETKIKTPVDMYSRTNTMTLSIQQERFAFAGMATRSTEPEVFTFEQAPAQATAMRSYVPVRPKKRCTRVMYPAKVRMHLPPPEKNQAKRWLVILCLVVLWQIYTEEPYAETPLAPADGPASDCQGFPFKSAEEKGDFHSKAELIPGSTPSSEDANSSDAQMVPTVTCSEPQRKAESSRYEQQGSGAGKSMVALLVYHRLGSDS